MHDRAEHLVERVLPRVPIRQYVLSPFSELVGLLAARREALWALGRSFIASIFRWIQSRNASGNLHCGAMVYDPEIGRWLAKDPIGFEGGDASLYSYVGQDPVKNIDPTGLATLTNNSSRPVWVAGEDGSRAQLLRPGQTAEVDGVYNTPDAPIAGAPLGGAARKLRDWGSWRLVDGRDGRVRLAADEQLTFELDWLDPNASWKSDEWLSQNGWDPRPGNSDHSGPPSRPGGCP